MSKHIHLILTAAFYGAVLLLILRAPNPEIKPVPPPLYLGLISGSQRGFLEFGHQFSGFKKYFKEDEPVTFLMDTPFDPYARGIEKYFTAQSFFIPLILNPEPKEKSAIIYCSDHTIADRRLQETGYRLVAVEGDGKGVAVKP